MTKAENTAGITVVTTCCRDVELEDAKSNWTEGKVCVSVLRYSLPRTRLSQQPRNDALAWPSCLSTRVKHNEAFVRVCTRVPSANRIGASAWAQSLKGSGKSPPPHSQTQKKLKTKHWFACTHAPSPSAWLICKQFVLAVFCAEVADSAGGHLTISPTHCCQSLHNNTH